jgi:hypothetical protein
MYEHDCIWVCWGLVRTLVFLQEKGGWGSARSSNARQEVLFRNSSINRTQGKSTHQPSAVKQAGEEWHIGLETEGGRVLWSPKYPEKLFEWWWCQMIWKLNLLELRLSGYGTDIGPWLMDTARLDRLWASSRRVKGAIGKREESAAKRRRSNNDNRRRLLET